MRTWQELFGPIDESVVKVGRWGEQFIRSPREQIQERYREKKKSVIKGSSEHLELVECFNAAMRELRL